MKKLFLISFFTFFIATNFWSQNAYIQVVGEPNLKVYLNNDYKGNTQKDIGGLIIENVNAGKNNIKIEKTGYAPYNEDVVVKAGEVLLYKVKPFVKHAVTFSESGNTETADKQEVLKTGKLVIQSVPIEINISIPDIDGASNISKKKDIWTAESVPVGSYKVKLSFNGKVVEKTISIYENETTSIFGNLLKEEIKVTNTKEEKELKRKEKEEMEKYYSRIASLVDAWDYDFIAKIGGNLKEIKKNKKDYFTKTMKLDDIFYGETSSQIYYLDDNDEMITSYMVIIPQNNAQSFFENFKKYLKENKLYVEYIPINDNYQIYKILSPKSNYSIALQFFNGNFSLIKYPKSSNKYTTVENPQNVKSEIQVW